ncbi:MAG: hypothetical protein J6386_17495 [Candidatus Synoicihabitans palmerolidicus]|nr:hypothetical protein [Candidatus Synoicihabitans palmerolidicus]
MHYDGQSVSPIEGPVSDHIRDGRLSGLARLPDGRLLFTSYGRGVLVTDPDLNPLVQLDDTNGLPARTVICSFVTSRHVVWLGTENGIVRLDFTTGVTRFTPHHGLDPNGVDTVARLQGSIVFATNDGPFILKANENPVANPHFRRWASIEDNLNVFLPIEDGVLTGGLRGLWWVHEGEVKDLESPSNIRALHRHSRFPDHLVGLHLTGLALWRREGTRVGLRPLCARASRRTAKHQRGLGRQPFGGDDQRRLLAFALR